MKNNCKRLLFILPSGDIGGTRTSLVNLITNMDRQRYDIDVLLLFRRGPLVAEFEQICNLLPQNKTIKAGRGMGSELIKAFDLLSLIRRISLNLRAKMLKRTRYELCYQSAAKQYSDKYDCVIAFQEKDATEFAQYISAPKKIAWVHTDYSRAIKGRGEKALSEVSNKFDKVVFVSNACMNEFKQKTHIEHSKMLCIYNTFDCDDIIKKSGEYTVEKDKSMPMLVSIGRFCEQKSFHRAIRAAYRLKNEGYRFLWYIIGDGELFDEINAEIIEKNVGDSVILTGRKSNPYPYMAAADAMILTSVFEAHPMVATESLILSTPVVSASFPSAAESVLDGQNGILCDNNSEGVYQGVKRILSNPELLNKLKANVENFKYDNLAIIKQIEELID